MTLVKPNFLSLIPIKTEFFFNDTNLAIGTSFFYEIDNNLYLISNWHNFAGRNPMTGKPQSSTAGVPNKIKCRLILDKEFLEWSDYTFDLCDKDGIPRWFQHPREGRIIDVAALKVELPSKFKKLEINQYKFTDMRVEIAQDVFILGFPIGIAGRKELPVWKRGSIASEPGGNYPRILIDTATRKGMSGAPVIMLNLLLKCNTSYIRKYEVPTLKAGGKE